MAWYRKRPVMIEAIKWDDSDSAWYAINEWQSICEAFRHADRSLSITTLEGTMRAEIGDFIIKGVRDELYPCKPDIFLETNEFVKE